MKPSNNSKTNNNSIKLTKYGKKRTLTWRSIKKVTKTEDGFLQILIRKNFFWMTSSQTYRQLHPANMQEHFHQELEIGKDH